eukprot:1181721-Pyramimonas_sp.AAC.1
MHSARHVLPGPFVWSLDYAIVRKSSSLSNTQATHSYGRFRLPVLPQELSIGSGAQGVIF